MKRSAKRHSGISKRTIVHRSRIGGPDSTVIASGKQNEREAAAQERRREAIKGKPSFQSMFKIFTIEFHSVTTMVRTPALCLLDTSDKSFFFMPTIFVVHLMLDSYGQPHFLTYTVPCPLPLFYIWFLPYYEYGSIPCSLIRTSPCTYMYINPCT